MAKFIIFFLSIFLFINISFAERKTFLTPKEKEELYLLLKDDLTYIKKLKEYIEKNKISFKKEKLFLIKLLILYYRLDDLDNLTKLMNNIPATNYSDPFEKEIIRLISNYILLNFYSEKAIANFEKNFYEYITLLPSEKFHTYANTAIKIGRCDFALKIISYEIEKQLANPFFEERLYNTAYCFYKKGDYSKSFLLLNRLAFTFPDYKKNLVKQYLIDIYIKTNKKSPSIKDYSFESLENFLFEGSLIPLNNDTRKIYLDLLSSKKGKIDDMLFNRAVLILELSKDVLKKTNYKYYLTKLTNKCLKFLSTSNDEFLIVEDYFLAKRKGFKPSDLGKPQKSILFNALIKFKDFDEANLIYKSGSIDYNLSGNAVLKLYLKQNKQIPKGILKKLENQKKVNPQLLLRYFTKVNPDIKKSKHYLMLSLKKDENLNFLPSYLERYFAKKRFSKLNYYKGILNFQINEKNFVIFLDYLLTLYKERDFELVKKLISKFENSPVKDDFVDFTIFYIKNSIAYRENISSNPNITPDEKIDIYRLWFNSIQQSLNQIINID